MYYDVFYFTTENQFDRYIDDDHGEGRGFEMGIEISDHQSLYTDLDENFDPLQYDTKDIADSKNRPNCDISITKNKSSTPLQRKRKDIEGNAETKEEGEPCDEEDEEEDDFIQKGNLGTFDSFDQLRNEKYQ